MHYINNIFLALFTYVFSLFCGAFILHRLSPPKLFGRYRRRFLFNREGCYRRLGIYRFGFLMSLGPFSYLDHHLLYSPNYHRHSLEDAMFRHFKREAEHLLAFLLLIGVAIGACFSGITWTYIILLCALNLLFNLCPFLYHQSVRLRMVALIDRYDPPTGES
ncbi:hypothetical protein [Echinicola vietnamensis]|uniref:Glycosyl-4,4'-diaponeurosporenoate acyltransferase n=1 Tax=Echinicola vietnamensis (strain DSM 17526 / LMG 23754 / KMM 6221) TaxID=926556 RepID=L0G623_ECHVK|nr:hypothetical protein [Echinicola vietnamensis]AGA80446.1 hypothetical protein Echvi_4252 [Echinicola vietnamensis DSM 17526]